MIRKNSMFKRGISLFLCCLMIFSLLSNVAVSVYASNNSGQSGQSGQSAQSTAVSFIDFYSGSGSEMTLDSLTTQDYYAMAVYMSNWFKPGETTLADIIMEGGTESDFYKDFSGYMKKNNDPYLQPVIQGLGQDFYNAINSGDCTIVLSDGKPATGVDFLYAMMSSVDESNVLDKVWLKGEDFSGDIDDNTQGNVGLKSKYSKLYFGNNTNITFDFSLPAYKAAIQVLFAYYPSLFISEKGIVALDRLYVDAVGNIWGLSELDVNGGNYDSSRPTQNTVMDASKVFLVFPACLNPSAFTNGVKSSDLTTTKFPLANRFALSAISTVNQFCDVNSFSNAAVPIYNIIGSSKKSKDILNIFAISSLSGYLFQTDNISKNTWSEDNRRET